MVQRYNLPLGRFGSGGISMGDGWVIGGGCLGGDRFRSILSGDERRSGLDSRVSSPVADPGPLSKPGGMSRILWVSMCCFMLPWGEIWE